MYLLRFVNEPVPRNEVLVSRQTEGETKPTVEDAYMQAIDVNITQAIANEAKAKGYNLVLSKQGQVLYSSDDLSANIQKAVK